MKAFVSALEKELAGRLRKIESSDLSILKKSLEASLVLGDAFQRLREFVSSYTFESEAEEIEFFKTIKPRLYCRLIYYRKVYNIEMNRPVGIESQYAYLHDEIKAIDRYNDKHSDFVRYYRSGMTHLDSLYYLRNRTDAALPRIVPLRTRPEILDQRRFQGGMHHGQRTIGGLSFQRDRNVGAATSREFTVRPAYVGPLENRFARTNLRLGQLQSIR